MDLNLSNRTALVCGASQGIGRATAIELAQLGANVILLSRSQEKLQAVLEELDLSQNQKHHLVALDLSDRDSLKKETEALLTQYHSIDILINNTAGPKAGLIKDASEADLLSAFESHLLSARLLLERLLPGMVAKQYGRIINVTSTSVKVPIANLGVSNTIRWAMTGWAKTLSQEIAKDGITVNTILPGFTETPRLEAIIQGKVSESVDEEKVKHNMTQTVPSRRFGKASEVANAIAFLASPAASYINGVALAVDGGRTGCI